MDVTTQRRCLEAIAGGLLIGTVGSVAWSLSSTESPDVAQATARESVPQAATSSQPRPSSDPVISQSLRGPLYDPPPAQRATTPAPVPAPTPPPQPTLEVTLVGTIIERDQSLAILADSSGKFDVKGVGQPLELSPQGITLEQIEPEQVTLRYQGRRSTVQLDRSAKRSSGGAVKRANSRRRNR